MNTRATRRTPLPAPRLSTSPSVCAASPPRRSILQDIREESPDYDTRLEELRSTISDFFQYAKDCGKKYSEVRAQLGFQTQTGRKNNLFNCWQRQNCERLQAAHPALPPAAFVRDVVAPAYADFKETATPEDITRVILGHTGAERKQDHSRAKADKIYKERIQRLKISIEQARTLENIQILALVIPGDADARAAEVLGLDALWPHFVRAFGTDAAAQQGIRNMQASLWLDSIQRHAVAAAGDESTQSLTSSTKEAREEVVLAFATHVRSKVGARILTRLQRSARGGALPWGKLFLLLQEHASLSFEASAWPLLAWQYMVNTRGQKGIINSAEDITHVSGLSNPRAWSAAACAAVTAAIKNGQLRLRPLEAVQPARLPAAPLQAVRAQDAPQVPLLPSALPATAPSFPVAAPSLAQLPPLLPPHLYSAALPSTYPGAGSSTYGQALLRLPDASLSSPLHARPWPTASQHPAYYTSSFPSHMF